MPAASKSKPTEQMQMVLDALKDMGGLPIESLTPQQARLMPLPDKAALHVYGHHFLKKAAVPMPLDVGKIEHKLIPSEGQDITARIYTPEGKAPSTGWPVVVYYHGGGWVIADLNTYDSSCRALCDEVNAIIVSVHYRQAPEHKWPAAPHDALTAYKWVCKHAVKLGGNAKKIAVAGESAGGNLATVVAMMARDEGIQMPVHQLLVYPVTDIANGSKSESAKQHANAVPLNKPMLEWFYTHYLPAKADRENSYISPLYGDLRDMPETTIILAEIDPLRSDGEEYAVRLGNAGVDVSIQIYEGVTHEFFGLAGLVDEASHAVKFAADELKQAFNHEESIVDKTLSKVFAN